MILTCHLLAGAAVASKISNPFLALPLAFLSHYFLDLLPHKDYSIISIMQRWWNKSFSDFFKVFMDICFGILLIFLFSKNSPVIFAAALLSIVPDGITFLGIVFPKNMAIARHQNLHVTINTVGGLDVNKKILSFFGFFSQALVIIITTYLL